MTAAEIAGLLAEHEFWNCVFNGCCGDDATEADHRAHLADLLADHVRRARAEALREFAAQRDDMAAAWGDRSPWLTNGAHVADLVAYMASEEADRINTEETP